MTAETASGSDLTVSVRRHPQDWTTAVYRFSDISDLRWDTVSGGVQRATAYPSLFDMCFAIGRYQVKLLIRVYTGRSPSDQSMPAKGLQQRRLERDSFARSS